jgi:hypothetical protein
VIGFKRQPLKQVPEFFDEITLDLDRALEPSEIIFTHQATRLNIAQTIENIRSYLKTGKALFEVDPESMY